MFLFCSIYVNNLVMYQIKIIYIYVCVNFFMQAIFLFIHRVKSIIEIPLHLSRHFESNLILFDKLKIEEIGNILCHFFFKKKLFYLS